MLFLYKNIRNNNYNIMENNITICGIGKLGLGLALLIENAGYNVLGIDITEEYIKHLNEKTF
jgi:UDP-N-acetyl-D-mannosaminuronate dehydrogenase